MIEFVAQMMFQLYGRALLQKLVFSPTLFLMAFYGSRQIQLLIIHSAYLLALKIDLKVV